MNIVVGRNKECYYVHKIVGICVKKKKTYNIWDSNPGILIDSTISNHSTSGPIRKSLDYNSTDGL